MGKPGKLFCGAVEMPSKCDICGKPRNQKVHTKCSKIRQKQHEQILLNEEFDRLLMFDLKRDRK